MYEELSRLPETWAEFNCEDTLGKLSVHRRKLPICLSFKLQTLHIVLRSVIAASQLTTMLDLKQCAHLAG